MAERDLSSPQGKRTGPQGPTGKPGGEFDRTLMEATEIDWSKTEEEYRQMYIDTIFQRYHTLVTEFYTSGNLCVQRFQDFSKSHKQWRQLIINGTGVVALANLIAAYTSNSQAWGWFSLVAAVLAVGLAILANLESYHNYSDRARAFRESRELFLDAAREFERRWHANVFPFRYGSRACLTSTELYKEIVAKDQELRTKFSELTKVEQKAAKDS